MPPIPGQVPPPVVFTPTCIQQEHVRALLAPARTCHHLGSPCSPFSTPFAFTPTCIQQQHVRVPVALLVHETLHARITSGAAAACRAGVNGVEGMRRSQLQNTIAAACDVIYRSLSTSPLDCQDCINCRSHSWCQLLPARLPREHMMSHPFHFPRTRHLTTGLPGLLQVAQLVSVATSIPGNSA